VETKEARKALGGPDGTVVLYAGLHGLAQGLEQLVEAAARLRDQSQFRLVLVGDGPEKAKLVEDARRRGLTNIDFLEPRTFAEMPGLLAAADVIVVPLKAAIPGAVPSKLYEAMASGRPTVLVGTGEAAEVVREHDAGIVVDPGDVDSLVAAIRQLGSSPDLCKRLGESGRRGACESFDRDKICGRFIDHLEGVQ
jgi:glycosyltransferase involved in cell wall biosynthesis